MSKPNYLHWWQRFSAIEIRQIKVSQQAMARRTTKTMANPHTPVSAVEENSNNDIGIEVPGDLTSQSSALRLSTIPRNWRTFHRNILQ